MEMDKDKGNPSYYAVIPASVRYSAVSPNAKLLYGEITALCNQAGYCFARNQYFAGLYKSSARTVTRWISELQENNFIRVVHVAEGRKIYINLEPGQSAQKKEAGEKSTAKRKGDYPAECIELEKIYLDNYAMLHSKGMVLSDKPIVDWGKARKLLKSKVKSYGVEILEKAIRKSLDDDFVVSKGYSLSMILSDSILASLVNGESKRKATDKGVGVGRGVDSYTDNGVEF